MLRFSARVRKRVCQEDNKHFLVFLCYVIKMTLWRSLLHNRDFTGVFKSAAFVM